MPRSNTRSDRADVYTRITAEIIAAIEAGAEKYRMPWHHDGSAIASPVNLASGKRYRGVNTVALWVAASSAGYGQGLWGTYRQWQAAGAQVRKGARATTIVLWKEFVSSEEKDEEANDSSHRPKLFARAFSVFNVDQVDNYQPKLLPILPENERLAHADAFIGNLGIATVFEGSEAYYRPSTDTIYMPPFAHFRDAASFYGVWTHEIGNIASVLARSRVSSPEIMRSK